MSELKVLVVGSGGREHALVWALKASDSVKWVDAAPGNPGMKELGRNWSVAADDLDGLESLVRGQTYDLVVVGPEDPLARGLADRIQDTGAAVFGPGAEGARLESNKAFAKEFMERHHIPTAPFRVVTDFPEAEKVLRDWGAPVVVKASGLAAGKGVVVAETLDEARVAVMRCLKLKRFGEAGETVVIEKKLAGEEVSVLVLTDGRDYHLLPGSQDHKRAYDGDLGPNTGGMGAYSPAPVLSPELEERIKESILVPSLSGLREDGVVYRGLLYIGVMITTEGPQVLEYNVRFGDPEAQAVLPRLGWDLGAVLHNTARGELGREPLPEPEFQSAACVVAAAADYPHSGARGLPVTGLEEAPKRGAMIFHAGTAWEDDTVVTAGGRVLGLVGRGRTLRESLDRAYAGIAAVHFEGMRYRKDIGFRALSRISAGKGV